MGPNPTPATNFMNNNPIGVFDSGVGGLSILSQIQQILPLETTIYVADSAYMPYGQKTDEQIMERADKIVSFFKDKNVKAVVVACNTATIAAIESLRKTFEFPIIGTVPVVKTIAKLTKTGNIAVFATSSSSNSDYMDDMIEKFAAEANVIKVGESHLENLIEEGNIDSPEIEKILRLELEPLLKASVDAIALGCTHYPFIKKRIEKIVGKDVVVCDSGGAVARRLKQVLETENLLSLQKGSDAYYTTGDSQKFATVASKLVGKTIEVQHIDL